MTLLKGMSGVSSPYLKPDRLAHVLAAIQVMAVSDQYRRHVTDWTYYLSGIKATKSQSQSSEPDSDPDSDSTPTPTSSPRPDPTPRMMLLNNGASSLTNIRNSSGSHPGSLATMLWFCAADCRGVSTWTSETLLAQRTSLRCHRNSVRRKLPVLRFLPLKSRCFLMRRSACIAKQQSGKLRSGQSG